MDDLSSAAGKVFGHYRVEGQLGAGGMGVVYSAYDTVLERKVAIKVVGDRVLVDKTARDLLLHEARAASSLNHPNICTIHEVGDSEGEAYIVMERVEGHPLSSLLGTGGLPSDSVIRYGMQIADALAHAHKHRVIHRDLKSTNALVTPEGRVKVLDFGLASRLRDSELQEATASKSPLTESRMIVGTLPYLAPELLRGDPADERTDIWALGVLLHEMASGTHPFLGRTGFELTSSILRDPPTPLPARVPPGLRAIIARCLEKSPGERYQRAGEVHSALEVLPRSQSGISAPSSAPSLGKADSDGLAEGREDTPHVRGKLWWKIAVPVLLALLLTAGLYYRFHQNQGLTGKDTIVVVDFSNSTGDPVFDDALKTALRISLQQSPFLNLISEGQIAATRRMMTLPAATKITPDLARELCQRTRSKVYIGGAIGSLDNEYVLGLKAVNCRTGDTIAHQQVTVASKEKVLQALGEVATRMRGELGESLATVQRFDVPLVQATTSSLDALKAYSLARKAQNEKGSGPALAYDQRAIELDPNFATAYDALGGDYYGQAELGRASEYYTKAFELREHASQGEKMTITADYYSSVTGELEKAVQAYKEEIESYPRASAAYNNLGTVYGALGQYEKAIEITRQVMQLRLTADQSVQYGNLANYSMALQRFDEARQTIHDAQARKLDDSLFHNALYALAFLGSDAAAMQEQKQWFGSNPDLENYQLALESDSQAYGGHLAKAQELTRQAAESAIKADSKENAAIWLAIAAQREAAYGQTTTARQTAADALKLAPASLGAAAESGLASALAVDKARAESVAQDLEKRFPLDTQIQSIWLPSIRGQLALNRKDAVLALNMVKAPSEVELGQIEAVINMSCLYSVYVRGQAYLAAGQGRASAAEFQKIIDHDGIVWNCWTGALAHLGLARANVLEFRDSKGADADAARVRALNAYKDFLTLWKDADPDVPILKQAKAEYAKLQ